MSRVSFDQTAQPPALCLFVVRRLHDLARNKSTPLYTCFIALTKAYNSVERELVWSVLQTLRVPHKMLAVIGQFHDRMRARVRMDDGTCSKDSSWDRGCGRNAIWCPHCLFNIYFPVVVNIALKEFREGEEVMADMVTVKRKAKKTATEGEVKIGGKRRACGGSELHLGYALRR